MVIQEILISKSVNIGSPSASLVEKYWIGKKLVIFSVPVSSMVVEYTEGQEVATWNASSNNILIEIIQRNVDDCAVSSRKGDSLGKV
jgi:hypothetical protein